MLGYLPVSDAMTASGRLLLVNFAFVVSASKHQAAGHLALSAYGTGIGEAEVSECCSGRIGLGDYRGPLHAPAFPDRPLREQKAKGLMPHSLSREITPCRSRIQTPEKFHPFPAAPGRTSRPVKTHPSSD